MSSTPTEATKSWIQSIVIKLNLCPFAKQPFQSQTIRYVETSTTHTEEALAELHHELTVISEAADKDVETSLIILTGGWESFDEYLDLVELAQQLLFDLNLEGSIQIATFHPAYQFADLEMADVRNYTNRSPYPMIHLLRETSISRAVDSHPDVESIPIRNQELLLRLKIDHFIK